MFGQENHFSKTYLKMTSFADRKLYILTYDGAGGQTVHNFWDTLENFVIGVQISCVVASKLSSQQGDTVTSLKIV